MEERNVEIEEIANELVDAKDQLETLAANYVGLDADPLFYEPLETITKILEEIE